MGSRNAYRDRCAPIRGDGAGQRAGDGNDAAVRGGELSVLLAHVQAVTTTEAAGRDAWSLRHAAETEPIPALGR